MLLFGVILAVDSDTFDSGTRGSSSRSCCVIAFGGVGQRTGAYYMDVQKRAEAPDAIGGRGARPAARSDRSELLHFTGVALFVLIVLDMIFKPGA